jgi:acetyl-CoA carboxylase biotin carboxyl carrier protein
MTLRFDQVAELIKIIDASACQELVLETTELKLVVRNGSVDAASSPKSPETPQLVSASVAGPELIKTPAPSEPGLARSNFYRAPSPDSPPFVEVGTKVATGQPLCVIEVMKLFTTIYAEVGGEIKQIGASNGELVEYGRLLFIIDQDA